jgi:hypothetical protein
MIVDPDFVDHWKTRTLVALLDDDEAAPLYVIRLWAHCQNRRTWYFDLPAAALKAICRYSGDASRLEQAMTECGFVSRQGVQITVVGWDVYNASLIAAWANGGRGGRPRKAKIEDSKETHGIPDENPWVTPRVTHGVTDKIRVDKNKDISPSSEGFDRFWKAWPASDRKTAKAKCAEKWDKGGFESVSAEILAHVETMKATNKQWQTGYEPAPLTYLNQQRWKDSEGADGCWWSEAGFGKEWQAVNAGCTAVNAYQWRNGERIKEQAA